MSIVVSDTSPLIALERIHSLELLQRLFGPIYIPSTVRAEIFKTQRLPDWIVEKNPVATFHPSKSLGKGEIEAIALAVELNADLLLMDDLEGRKEAKRVGLTVMGTIGVLIQAKRMGIIKTLSPLLEALEITGFYLNRELKATALSVVGELEG